MNIEKFAVSLSAEEIEKAGRFIRKSDRERYLFAHGVLRSILSSYVKCAPQKIIYEKNKHGKPCLARGVGNEIQFNMSHSGDMILIAVSKLTAIGIDIEHMRRVPDVKQIVNSVFSVEEREYINALPRYEYENGFFACWTAKEAFLKGMGMGLSYPLNEFSIIFSNGVPVGVKIVKDDLVYDNCWKIIGLSPGPGYSAAIAIAESINKLKFYEYS